jgi:hypothetical protein
LLKELVSRDNGVAFIERGAAKAELEEHLLKEVRITEGSPVVRIAVAYGNQKEVSPPAGAFMRFLMEAGNRGFFAASDARGTGIRTHSSTVSAPDGPSRRRSSQFEVMLHEGGETLAFGNALKSLQEYDFSPNEYRDEHGVELNCEVGGFE